MGIAAGHRARRRSGPCAAAGAAGRPPRTRARDSSAGLSEGRGARHAQRRWQPRQPVLAQPCQLRHPSRAGFRRSARHGIPDRSLHQQLPGHPGAPGPPRAPEPAPGRCHPERASGDYGWRDAPAGGSRRRVCDPGPAQPAGAMEQRAHPAFGATPTSPRARGDSLPPDRLGGDPSAEQLGTYGSRRSRGLFRELLVPEACRVRRPPGLGRRALPGQRRALEVRPRIFRRTASSSASRSTGFPTRSTWPKIVPRASAAITLTTTTGTSRSPGLALNARRVAQPSMPGISGAAPGARRGRARTARRARAAP